MPHSLEGQMNARGLRVAIVATRFNDFIVERLVSGAMDFLVRHGMTQDDALLIRVPGAYELPLACKKAAEMRKFDGIIALGCVIRGGTPHFEYVCGEAAKGIAQVMLETETPIGFGLLTCDTLEQAIDRAGVKAGNKGVEAASAMLEMVRVLEQMQ